MSKFFDNILKGIGLKKRRPESDPIKFPHLWELSFGDRSRFKRIWTIRINTARLIALSVFLFLVVSFLGVMIVVNTPLRSYLPGYLNTDERHSFEGLAERIDSISAVNSVQADYFNNIQAILFETEDQPVDTVPEVAVKMASRDSLSLIPVDSILPTSETERSFAREYERRERHNLSVLSPVAAEGMVFHRPLMAATLEAAKGDGLIDSRSVTLRSTASAPVSTVYSGTVIATYNEPGEGIAVIVQHPREFVSVYRGLSSVYVKPGDKLPTGTRIGTLASTDPMMRFSLWRSGVALDAASYIPF